MGPHRPVVGKKQASLPAKAFTMKRSKANVDVTQNDVVDAEASLLWTLSNVAAKSEAVQLPPPGASHRNGHTPSKRQKKCPMCVSCAGANVSTLGGGTLGKYRYACHDCGSNWQQIPPHRKPHVDSDSEVCFRKRPTGQHYKCGRSGAPKRGHICALLAAGDATPPPKPEEARTIENSTKPMTSSEDGSRPSPLRDGSGPEISQHESARLVILLSKHRFHASFQSTAEALSAPDEKRVEGPTRPPKKRLKPMPSPQRPVVRPDAEHAHPLLAAKSSCATNPALHSDAPIVSADDALRVKRDAASSHRSSSACPARPASPKPEVAAAPAMGSPAAAAIASNASNKNIKAISTDMATHVTAPGAASSTACHPKCAQSSCAFSQHTSAQHCQPASGPCWTPWPYQQYAAQCGQYGAGGSHMGVLSANFMPQHSNDMGAMGADCHKPPFCSPYASMASIGPHGESMPPAALWPPNAALFDANAHMTMQQAMGGMPMGMRYFQGNCFPSDSPGSLPSRWQPQFASQNFFSESLASPYLAQQLRPQTLSNAAAPLSGSASMCLPTHLPLPQNSFWSGAYGGYPLAMDGQQQGGWGYAPCPSQPMNDGVLIRDASADTVLLPPAIQPQNCCNNVMQMSQNAQSNQGGHFHGLSFPQGQQLQTM